MATAVEDPYALAKPPPEQTVTYEQFLEWLDENTFAEWVDGEVVPMSAASAQHQDISGFLGALLRLYAEKRHQRATPNAESRYENAVLPGFWMNVGWLRCPFLPPVRQVLKEWEAA